MNMMRDRLVKLLHDVECKGEEEFGNCPERRHGRCRTVQKLEMCQIGVIADHLLANGVIVPLCKVGDAVYTNVSMQGWYYRTKDRPYTARIVFIGVNDSEEMGCGYINVLFEKNHNMMQFRFSDIGKTIFLTREEAEQALKGEQLNGR